MITVIHGLNGRQEGHGANCEDNDDEEQGSTTILLKIISELFLKKSA